jgi:hypothetical protein
VFVPCKPFQPSLMFVGASLLGRLLALTAKIRPVCKGLIDTNTLEHLKITDVKSFMMFGQTLERRRRRARPTTASSFPSGRKSTATPSSPTQISNLSSKKMTSKTIPDPRARSTRDQRYKTFLSVFKISKSVSPWQAIQSTSLVEC